MTGPDEDELPDEIPVDDLVVDLVNLEVRFPDGGIAAVNGDIDRGVVPEDSVRDLPLGTLANALGLLSEHTEDGAPEGYFLEVDPVDRVYDLELHPGIALESYGQDQLYATVSIDLPRDLDEEFERNLETVVTPMLKLSGAIGRVSRVNLLFEHEVVVMVRFSEMKQRTVGDLIDLADHVGALLRAVRSGKASREVALGLVLGGHAQALVGQPESEWLDAKKQAWALGTAKGNAEAAKDMSALANAGGGLILVPAKTEVVNGREVISSISALPATRVDLTQIRDVLRQWVFPPLPDLVTEFVETKEGYGQLVVAVGAHRPDNWPHLVVGDPESEFPKQSFSAWVRDGDRNRAVEAPEVHALMRRQARVPPDHA